MLVTHTPPRYHLDLPQALGCEYLLKEIWRVRPRVHVFGHVHAAQGRESVWWDGGQAAWERMNGRKGWDAVDASAWVEGVRVLWHGVKGVLWKWGWGGEVSGGVMVNAALMYRNTGRLGNKASVLDIRTNARLDQIDFEGTCRTETIIIATQSLLCPTQCILNTPS